MMQHLKWSSNYPACSSASSRTTPLLALYPSGTSPLTYSSSGSTSPNSEVVTARSSLASTTSSPASANRGSSLDNNLSVEEEPTKNPSATHVDEDVWARIQLERADEALCQLRKGLVFYYQSKLRRVDVTEEVKRSYNQRSEEHAKAMAAYMSIGYRTGDLRHAASTEVLPGSHFQQEVSNYKRPPLKRRICKKDVKAIDLSILRLFPSPPGTPASPGKSFQPLILSSIGSTKHSSMTSTSGSRDIDKATVCGYSNTVTSMTVANIPMIALRPAKYQRTSPSGIEQHLEGFTLAGSVCTGKPLPPPPLPLPPQLQLPPVPPRPLAGRHHTATSPPPSSSESDGKSPVTSLTTLETKGLTKGLPSFPKASMPGHTLNTMVRGRARSFAALREAFDKGGELFSVVRKR